MDAFIITDASFLPRTHAAGVAGKIEADGKSFAFKGAVTNIMNPTHGEMIAVLHSLKKLREVRDNGAMDIDKVHIGTDCKSLITLMTEGYKKGRVYHSTTQRLLKEIDRTAKVMNIDLEFHKIKAHVEHNPTLLEELHNQVDRMAKHAMSTTPNPVTG
jgi:ribonuclease HI